MTLDLRPRAAQLLARIDALQVRERLMILVVSVVCALALAESLWLAPAQKRYDTSRQAVAQQQGALERLQAEAALQANPQAGAPGSARAQLASVNVQIDTTEKEIRARMPAGRDATSLRQVLEAFLQRHETLTLVRATTLSPDAAPLLGATPGITLTSAQSASGAGSERRGLELTVAGSYVALMQYVETLERALPDLRWGAMLLTSNETQGTQLTLQVFIVEAQP